MNHFPLYGTLGLTAGKGDQTAHRIFGWSGDLLRHHAELTQILPFAKLGQMIQCTLCQRGVQHRFLPDGDGQIPGVNQRVHEGKI